MSNNNSSEHHNLSVLQMKANPSSASPAKVGPLYHGRNTTTFLNYGANNPIGFSPVEKTVFIVVLVGIVAYAVYHFKFKY